MVPQDNNADIFYSPSCDKIRKAGKQMSDNTAISYSDKNYKYDLQQQNNLLSI